MTYVNETLFEADAPSWFHRDEKVNYKFMTYANETLRAFSIQAPSPILHRVQVLPVLFVFHPSSTYGIKLMKAVILICE